MLLLLAALPTAAPAQDVRWERVGEPFSAQGLDFAADGTLYAAGSAGLVRLTPEETWEVVADLYAYDIAVLGAGDVLVVEELDILRSTDGGQTWEEVYDKHGEISRLDDGTLYCGMVHFDPVGFTIRSDDGGATWEDVTFPEAWLHCDTFGQSGQPGHVLAGCAFGIGYSTDGGASFAPSSLWEENVYTGDSFTQLGDGTALALAAGGCCRGGIYRSTDGGQTWTFLFDVGMKAKLAAVGRTVFAVRYDSSVWRSADGGMTWEEVTPVYEGEEFLRANDVAMGPDGRLYVAGAVSGPPAAPSGVYRTVEPVFTVDAEAEPPEQRGTGLEVFPNPSGGMVTVRFTLATASDVTVSVYDMLGRRVASLAEGHWEAGSHRLTLDTSGLPAGVYVVRAGIGARTVTRRVTVLHGE